MTDDIDAFVQRLAGLDPEARREVLASMTPAQQQAIAAALLERPLIKATIGSTWKPNPRQVEAKALLDDPAVLHCLMYGGARSGKSVLGVKTVIERAIQAPGSRHLIARHRFNSARNSIWRATLPETLTRYFPGLEATPNASEFFYKLGNGSEIWVSGLDSDERTEKILGNEYLTALLEECSEIAWPTVEMVTTRVAQRFDGIEPKIIYCENPPLRSHWSFRTFIEKRNPEPPYKGLPHPDRWASIRLNPADNAANLPATYLEGLQTGSARKVLRFWRGEFGDAGEAALWTLEGIERNRVATAPDSLARIVVAVDPSGTAGASDDGDPIGIVVAGLDTMGTCYILEDATCKLPPAGWGAVAVSAFERWGADAMVVETNYGGQMAIAVLQAAAAQANVRVKIREVVASRGKAIRAEPISALYDQGKVCHVGVHVELEDELVSFTTAGYIGDRSPNRADAAIWACTEFFGKVTQNPEKRHRPPPRVFYSPGAAGQMRLPQGARAGGSGWGRPSFDGSYSVRADRDMSPARRRQLGLGAKRPGGANDVIGGWLTESTEEDMQ